MHFIIAFILLFITCSTVESIHQNFTVLDTVQTWNKNLIAFIYVFFVVWTGKQIGQRASGRYLPGRTQNSAGQCPVQHAPTLKPWAAFRDFFFSVEFVVHMNFQQNKFRVKRNVAVTSGVMMFSCSEAVPHPTDALCVCLYQLEGSPVFASPSQGQWGKTSETSDD